MTALASRVLELLPNARMHKEDPDDRHVIVWGPPGTGKTQSLSTLLDAHLRAGHAPGSLLVNAFTRNATAELRRRLRQEHGIEEFEMPWVRTVHSSCFKLLGLRSDQVVGPRSLRLFADATGYELKGVLAQRSLEDPYGGVAVATLGDWCYAAEELRRARRLTTEELVAGLRPPPVALGWDLDVARDFSFVYDRWKRESKLWDFTDMLERVLAEQLRPPVETLFIDECQDLTPLQWAVVDLWAADGARLFQFGDDDQSVFEFVGADPAALWRRPGHQFVLTHSYRLPAAILAEGRRLSRRLSAGVRKDFEPRDDGGVVRRVWDWRDFDFHEPGTHLLLVRNRAFLDELRTHLLHSAVPFRDRTSDAGVPDADSAIGMAIATLVRLCAGQPVSRGRLRQLRSQVPERLWPEPVGSGGAQALADLPIELADLIRESPLLTLELPRGQRDYLAAVSRQHDLSALTEQPRIELATIHGVKGEEADHVACAVAMTGRTHEEYVERPDPEHRVFYVAGTRARQSLTWVLSSGRGYWL